MSVHQQTLNAAMGGDDQALASLVHLYHDSVYRFGLRVCRDGFDADDAVQEAFSKLSRRSALIRDEGVLFWLLTVVKNACRRMLRPWSREHPRLGDPAQVPSPEAPNPEPDPLAALERFELVQAVHAGIASLDRPYREVLVLRDLEGLSGPETCAALGLELAAMKTRLHRARQQLRARLQPLSL